MKCEEFENVGLDLVRRSAMYGADAALRASAMEHANSCARCAALQESWRDAQMELQSLQDATRDLGAPLRVEMRLRQEFWATRRALKMRAAAVASAWILASAALLLVGVSWWNWHIAQETIALQSVNTPVKSDAAGANAATPADIDSAEASRSDAATEQTLVAANDAEDFTLLPGSLPQETGDGAVVRVRLQRGALGELGLPVNEERAGEWIQVDLFVGQDGQPQAVRLPQ
jgi:hypothetical protein